MWPGELIPHRTDCREYIRLLSVRECRGGEGRGYFESTLHAEHDPVQSVPAVGTVPERSTVTAANNGPCYFTTFITSLSVPLTSTISWPLSGTRNCTLAFLHLPAQTTISF